MNPDYYQILGVPMDADSQAIKQAYRHLARQYHPDASDQANKLKFTEATEAYRTLIQPERRAAYDLMLKNRWQVSAQTTPHRYQHVNTENMRPFVMLLVGFLGFSLFMMLVMMVILLEFSPDKLSADEIRQLQDQTLQVCKIDFSREDTNCRGLTSITIMGDDLRIEVERSLRLVMVPSEGWQLLVEDGTGALVRVVDDRLTVEPSGGGALLVNEANFTGQSISLEWRHQSMLWRSDQQRGSVDSSALFSFPTTFTVQSEALHTLEIIVD